MTEKAQGSNPRLPPNQVNPVSSRLNLEPDRFNELRAPSPASCRFQHVNPDGYEACRLKKLRTLAIDLVDHVVAIVSA